MTTDSIATASVAYFDTNILHFVPLYLEFASKHNLYPLYHSNGADASNCLQDALVKLGVEDEVALRKNLQVGLAVVWRALQDHIEVRYALASELELLASRMKGRAILKAANEGLPSRMWSKFQESEIRRRLTLTDGEELSHDVQRIAVTLSTAGILVGQENPKDARDVLALAKFVTGLIYLDAMDSIIYSAALIGQADELFTVDGYFRKTVNYIHNPMTPEHQEISRRIKDEVTDVLGWARGQDHVIVPEAKRIGQFIPGDVKETARAIVDQGAAS